MMEPVSLISTAILSQFQTSALIGTVIGGIVGNRADVILCNSTNKIYERIKNQKDEPANHDIQRAVRNSYLKSTLIAVGQAKSKYKYRKHKPSDFTKIEKYLKSELNKLDKPEVEFPKADLHQHYQQLLKPKGGTANERLPDMILGLKKSLLAELKEQSLLIGPTFRQSIMEGWKDEGKKRDWYELTCAFFAEELKNNSRLSAIIQKNYLEGISTDVNTLAITVDGIEEKLDIFFTDYKALLPKVDQILTTVQRTEEKVDELPEKFKEILVRELDKRKNVKEPPNFQASKRFKDLNSKIETLQQEESDVKAEITDLKKDIKKTNSGNKDRKERSLRRREAEFLGLNEERLEAEKELETFITDVIQLAEQFSSDELDSTPRLAKAKELFEQGRYEEVDEILNEKDIYDDIEKHKDKSKQLADELTVKAKTITVNKNDRWFEKARKYYRDASDIHPSYDTYFDYAYFLQEHLKINRAISAYEKAKRYIENNFERAHIMNNLAMLQKSINEIEDARENYMNALHIYRELAEKNSEDYHQADVALVLSNLGNLQKDLDEIEEARKSYEEALQIRRELAEENPQAYLPYVAGTLNNLGNLQRKNLEMVSAHESYTEALKINQDLAEQNPIAYQSEVAGTLHNLGILQKDNDEIEKAQRSFNEALGIRRELAEQNPHVYRKYVADTLNSLATLQETDLAKKNYTEALQIYRDLDEMNPQVYSGIVAGVLNNIGDRYRENNEVEKARESYIEALQINCKLANHNPVVYRPEVADTLHKLANLHRETNEIEVARKSYIEALQIRRDLVEQNPQTYKPRVANILHNLGILQSKKNETEDALQNYTEALQIYREFAEHNPATYRPDVAHTLNSLAILYIKIKDKSQSIRYANEAMELLKSHIKASTLVKTQYDKALEILTYWEKN